MGQGARPCRGPQAAAGVCGSVRSVRSAHLGGRGGRHVARGAVRVRVAGQGRLPRGVQEGVLEELVKGDALHRAAPQQLHKHVAGSAPGSSCACPACTPCEPCIGPLPREQPTRLPAACSKKLQLKLPKPCSCRGLLQCLDQRSACHCSEAPVGRDTPISLRARAARRTWLMMWTAAGDRASLIASGRRASARSMLRSRCTWLLPLKGGRPVTSSNRMVPTLHRSACERQRCTQAPHGEQGWVPGQCLCACSQPRRRCSR